MQILTSVALLACVTSASLAQGSGLNVELHANQNVSASSMGLPRFPDSRTFKNASSDSAVDMGFTFGSIHFRILATKYVASASEDEVLDFYRKPLSRFGEVLECDHGRPVGSPTVMRGGISCTDSHHHDSHANVDVGDSHQLRSGSQQQFHVVAIDTVANGETRFSLVYLEVPKDEEKH